MTYFGIDSRSLKGSGLIVHYIVGVQLTYVIGVAFSPIDCNRDSFLPKVVLYTTRLVKT